MNLRSILVLARADLSLNRTPGLLYAGAAAAGAVIACTPTGPLRGVGVSLVMCVLIGLCFHLPIVTVFQEVARGTRAFTLSLPVTPGEYAAGKLAAGALLFLLPAGAAVLIALLMPASRRLFPTPMVLLALLGGLIFFMQNIGIALVTESMGVSMTILLGQIFVLGNGIPRLGPHLPGWFRFWEELHTGGPWREAAFALLVLELVLTVAVVLHLMGRKRSFV